jgi:endonuclease/exonuclease/phosphatase family metal-dependent hydrolase
MSVRYAWPAALVAVLAAVLTAAPVRAAAAPVRVMTFNICGNVCRHGEVTATAGNIAYQIRARHVDVAMLQEVCYSQFLGIRARLARYGFTAVFGRADRGGRCDDSDRRHGTGFGVALLARGTMTRALVRPLPGPPAGRAERRVLLAATVRTGGRSLSAVTTHTAPGGPALALQLAAVRRFIAPIAATRPVLFGGDLNSLPVSGDLDGFYAVLREADSRTDPQPTFVTVPRKIDYLFAGGLRPRAAAVARTRYSDHRMYLGVFG